MTSPKYKISPTTKIARFDPQYTNKITNTDTITTLKPQLSKKSPIDQKINEMLKLLPEVMNLPNGNIQQDSNQANNIIINDILRKMSDNNETKLNNGVLSINNEIYRLAINNKKIILTFQSNTGAGYIESNSNVSLLQYQEKYYNAIKHRVDVTPEQQKDIDNYRELVLKLLGFEFNVDPTGTTIKCKTHYNNSYNLLPSRQELLKSVKNINGINITSARQKLTDNPQEFKVTVRSTDPGGSQIYNDCKSEVLKELYNVSALDIKTTFSPVFKEYINSTTAKFSDSDLIENYINNVITKQEQRSKY
jgi:hypothetical protein